VDRAEWGGVRETKERRQEKKRDHIVIKGGERGSIGGEILAYVPGKTYTKEGISSHG